MAIDIKKYRSEKVKYHIGHNLRELDHGQKYQNEDIDSELKPMNYKLIDRGSKEDVNKYRLELEKRIHIFNRKDVVHAIEIIIQLPSDCPPEQAHLYFRECYNFVVADLIAKGGMGEDAILTADVHRDEHKYLRDSDGNYKYDENGNIIDISKEHLHIIYVPAIKDDKHPGFEYKMCADALTKRKDLNALHPALQKYINDKGIKATVYNPKNSGKTIKLSVAQLKEITNATGMVIDKSLTLEKLVELLVVHERVKVIDKELKLAYERIAELEKTRSVTVDKGGYWRSHSNSRETEISIEKRRI